MKMNYGSNRLGLSYTVMSVFYVVILILNIYCQIYLL